MRELCQSVSTFKRLLNQRIFQLALPDSSASPYFYSATDTDFMHFFFKLRNVFETSVTLFRSPTGVSSVYSLTGGGVHNSWKLSGSCPASMIRSILASSLRQRRCRTPRPGPVRSAPAHRRGQRARSAYLPACPIHAAPWQQTQRRRL